MRSVQLQSSSTRVHEDRGRRLCQKGVGILQVSVSLNRFWSDLVSTLAHFCDCLAPGRCSLREFVVLERLLVDVSDDVDF